MTEGNFLNITFPIKVSLIESPSGIKLSSLAFVKWRMYYLYKILSKLQIKMSM